MARRSRYSPEVKERAVRMVLDQQHQHESRVPVHGRESFFERPPKSFPTSLHRLFGGTGGGNQHAHVDPH